jgi:hypothetical protein
MQKIISLFQRNYDGDRLVRDEVVPGAEWVIAGEGVPTQKIDGTCCLVRAGELYRRYDLKAKKGRHDPPPGWEPAQAAPDPVTTSWPGWLKVGDKAEDQWFREAIKNGLPEDGTYELCGPKVQSNPEGYPDHRLIRHGSTVLADCPRSFEGIRDFLRDRDIEGIVWHHPDGRMVKVKKKDFGLKRK